MESVGRVAIPEYESAARENPGGHVNAGFSGEFSLLNERSMRGSQRHDGVRTGANVVFSDEQLVSIKEEPSRSGGVDAQELLEAQWT